MALLDGHGSPEGGAAAPSPTIPNQSQSTSEIERLSTLIAEQNSQLAALRESDEQFRGAFEQAAVGMIMADAAGRFTKVNRAFCELLGYDLVELMSRDLRSLVHPDDADATSELLRSISTSQLQASHLTQRYIQKCGRVIWARLDVCRVRAGENVCLSAIVQDVTAQMQAEWLEQDRRQILEMVAQDQPLPGIFSGVTRLVERQIAGAWACVLLLQDGTLHTFAPNLPGPLLDGIARRPVHFASTLVDGQMPPAKQPRVAFAATDPAWAQIRDIAASYNVKTSWTMQLRSNDGGPIGLIVVCSPHDREPTAAEAIVMEAALHLATVGIEHHHTTRQLAHLVRHDPLTGVPNRIFFEDRLDILLAQARRTGKPLALLALDLDRFKRVNDTMGHQAGDSLLQQFAQRLRTRIRESDTLARVGGDEFVIILPEVGSRENAQAIIGKLNQSLEEAPFNLGGRDVAIGSSIGLAMFPDDGANAFALQRYADCDMYRVKELAHPQLPPGQAA
ncbi:MAG TPA: diguanylate cyclase [Humisphaera sp.]|nr:diguanylate cyclase [Humisphaera sp.]